MLFVLALWLRVSAAEQQDTDTSASCSASDSYAGADEDNFFGRDWATRTERLLARAEEGEPGVTLHSKLPLIVEWDTFLSPTSVQTALRWYKKRRAQYYESDPEWCFTPEGTGEWIAQLQREGTLRAGDGAETCPLSDQSAKALERVSPHSVMASVDYNQPHDARTFAPIEAEIAARLGWEKSAFYYAGATSLLEYATRPCSTNATDASSRCSSISPHRRLVARPNSTPHPMARRRCSCARRPAVRCCGAIYMALGQDSVTSEPSICRVHRVAVENTLSRSGGEHAHVHCNRTLTLYRDPPSLTVVGTHPTRQLTTPRTDPCHKARHTASHTQTHPAFCPPAGACAQVHAAQPGLWRRAHGTPRALRRLALVPELPAGAAVRTAACKIRSGRPVLRPPVHCSASGVAERSRGADAAVS
jgi:hypothetical protein